MTRDDVEIIEKTTRYDGYFRIDSYRLRHRLHGGGWSEEMAREVFERGHAVAVILYDPAADAVVLLDQFRVGALVGGVPAWQTEVVAGIIEAGESAEEVARREALEEAGCRLLQLEPVCRFAVSPGGASETIQLYCGRVDSRGVGGVHGLAHEHEDIRVEVVSFAEARAMLEAGRITNATALVALQWLCLNRESLRARWGHRGRGAVGQVNEERGRRPESNMVADNSNRPMQLPADFKHYDKMIWQMPTWGIAIAAGTVAVANDISESCAMWHLPCSHVQAAVLIFGFLLTSALAYALVKMRMFQAATLTAHPPSPPFRVGFSAGSALGLALSLTAGGLLGLATAAEWPGLPVLIALGSSLGFSAWCLMDDWHSKVIKRIKETRERAPQQPNQIS